MPGITYPTPTQDQVDEVVRVDQVTRRFRGQTRAGVVNPANGRGGGGKLAFLDGQHPVYAACQAAWEKNERRLRGGEDVLVELRRFDWERKTPKQGEERTQYETRQDRATYVNLPDMFATTTIGHLMREAPSTGAGLSFGALGEVRRERNFQTPTRAELIYYNADGVGNDGSQWDNFWTAAMKRAMATGHRWIMVEAPREAPGTYARELEGLRPYLVEYSPTAVPNWHYDAGRLQFIVIRVPARTISVNGRGQMNGSDEDGYLLMVRSGFDGLGIDYAVGGWWLFDGNKRPVDEGRWMNTRGEIPVFPLFYERDGGTRRKPALSRAGLTELGAIAISFMDLMSAWMFDAWDAAMSITFLAGVDREGFNLALEKLDEGSRYIPLQLEERSQTAPTILDGSTGAVAAEVFAGLTEALFSQAERISAMEATGTPDASGASKQAGFNEDKAPRLALAASNLEQAQNTAIHFLEARWGFPSQSGSVVWPRKFELVDIVADVAALFDLQTRAGVVSATLTKKLMVAAARERGFLTDDAEAQVIENEIGEAAKAKATLMATPPTPFNRGANA